MRCVGCVWSTLKKGKSALVSGQERILWEDRGCVFKICMNCMGLEGRRKAKRRRTVRQGADRTQQQRKGSMGVDAPSIVYGGRERERMAEGWWWRKEKRKKEGRKRAEEGSGRRAGDGRCR